VRDLGNLYSAALPSWLAAAFDEAAQRGVDLTNRPMVAVGYGSGDAAESWPIRAVPGWEAAAKRIHTGKAVAAPLDLTREQYEALHDGREVELDYQPQDEFVISHVGERYDASFQDLGVEYYQYVG
jgi:hydroxymethylglutaryl-CoA synthase